MYLDKLLNDIPPTTRPARWLRGRQENPSGVRTVEWLVVRVSGRGVANRPRFL